MCGHLCIYQDFGIFCIASEGHQIDEHPVVFIIPENHFVMRSEANMIGLFHGRKVIFRNEFAKIHKKESAVSGVFSEVFYDS